MKRWISLMLSALLLWATLPAAAARSAPEAWTAIRAIEDRAEALCSPQGETERRGAYAREVDQMILAVQAAPDYLPGSLERHGDFFFWESRDGRANGYSPSLRAELRSRSGRGSPPPLEAAASLPLRETANVGGNREVGVCVPYSDSYYFRAEKTVALGRKLARSTGGSLRVCLQEEVSVDVLAQLLQSCGILLINSHGRTDYEVGDDHLSKANSSYICLPTDEGFTAADQRAVQGIYGSYRHAFYAGSSDDLSEQYYCVDGTCLANHMTADAPHSMVWLGLCLGMATEGLFQPLRDRGVEAMIGFSERVVTTTDQGYLDAFVEALLLDRSVGEAAAYMKEQVGCPDPAQVSHAPAWPIAVSSQDPYPGRNHLTEGQEVCSDWKLHPAHPLTVRVEPAGTADYSLTRSVVTVTPHRGYSFSGWEITEGYAEAVQQGSVLDLALTEPCELTLYMEARTPAALRFRTGPGQSAPALHEFIGDTVVLPQPEGSLEAGPWIYHFLGWSTEAIPQSTEQRPALLAAGSRLKLSQPDTTLYAVYGYFLPEDGLSRGQFRRVTEAPADWAGDYVITYQSTKALKASTAYSGQGIMSPGAVASDRSAGYFLDGDYLNEVPDEIVYRFSPGAAGTGPLKMLCSENYLAVPSSSALLSTAASPGAVGAIWRMKWSEDQAVIANVRFGTRTLQYSLTSSGFCTLTTQRTALTLYVRVPGQHLYTTQPLAESQALTCPDEAHCPGWRFLDMPPRGSWAHDPIDWALASDVAAGTASRYFSPTLSCSRAQILCFLWRAAGSPEPEGGACPFTDVSETAYYAKAVRWALERSITAGTGPERFSPNAPCTRAQALTFLWRAAGSPRPQSAVSPFRDVPADFWAGSAILWAAERGLAAGTGASRFSPEAVCSRAQILCFLWRAVRGGALTPDPTIA